MKNAYYGAAATIFNAEPMDFIVSGNNLNVPTAHWFATNLNSSCSGIARRTKTNQFFQTLFQQKLLPQKLCIYKCQTEKPKPSGYPTPIEPTPVKRL